MHLVGITPDEAALLGTRLNLHAANCGCEAGSVVSSLVVVGYAGYLGLARGWPTNWGVRDLLVGVAVLLAAALVGKALGILLARVHLVHELERLLERLEALPGRRAEA